jgi:MFS transporter, SP family, sugar:H+ symporter
VLSFFFVLRWVRETKGVELEEMRSDVGAVRGDGGSSG